MPLEPDNQIERVLKAYAKKRREEAGASFDMPAATRRLLQTEVARQRPKPDAGSPSFLQLLVSFWPRAAFAAALLVVLGLLIWVAAPVQNSRQELAKNVSQRVENLSTAEQTSKD